MNPKELLINSINYQEQHVFCKFSCLLDWSAGYTHDQLKKMLGNKAASLSSVKNWMTKIKQGDPVVESRHRGRSADSETRTERVDRIRLCFNESRHWSLRAISNKEEIPYSSVQRIVVHELKMKKIMKKWVPHELSSQQQEHRVLACRVNLERYSKDKNLLKRTLTIDESWVALYMAPDRSQSRSWVLPGEQPETQVLQNIHGPKRLLIMAMDFYGIAFWKLLPEKSTVTAEVYKEFLDEYIPPWLEGKPFNRPILLHDNARPHKASLVTSFLEEKKYQLGIILHILLI